MKIPLVSLKAQYLSIKKEINRAIQRVIDSTSFVGGEEIEKFEEEFARFCESKYTVGVGNGTDALYLSLRALGIKEGDEVITSIHTFIATVEAITLNKAIPVFVDIDKDTYNIDPSRIERAITKKTKAIIPVHIYGQPVDFDKIAEIAKRHNLFIIEDASQAHGAFYKGKRVGSLGDVAGFSFYPGKNLGAYGDGGACLSNSQEIIEKIRILCNHGRIDKYFHKIEGINSRLDNIQAAILRVKLKYLDTWNKKRREIAKKYDELLSGMNGIITPKILDGVSCVYHLYVIQTEKRDKLRERLNKEGISTGIHYPIPLHLQPAYKHLNLKEGSFPHSESLCKKVLSLPMFAELKDREIEYICYRIRKALT
ncbi:MAG: DegT/DnrJ/EryC1/StrS family aminotransferase [bacterium]